MVPNGVHNNERFHCIMLMQHIIHVHYDYNMYCTYFLAYSNNDPDKGGIILSFVALLRSIGTHCNLLGLYNRDRNEV